VLDTTLPPAAPPVSGRAGRLRRVSPTRSAVAALASVAVLVLLSPSYSLATTVLIYATAVLGCNLLLGYTGLMSFGQGIFFGVGAYVAGLSYVHLEVQAVTALLLATLVGMLTATVIGFLCIMQRGVNFVMLTFAFAALFGYLVYLLSDITGGENGLRGFPSLSLGLFGLRAVELTSAISVFVLVAICFVAVYVFLAQVTRSRFGATLMAIRENEDRAAAVGYNTTLFKLLAFTLSGLVTGLAGGLYASYLGSVPDTTLQPEISTTILVMTILGGTGSLYGSFLGAWIYLVLSDYLSQVWERWQILLAVALLAIVLYLRGGVWGALELIGRRLSQLRRKGG
jgi:branched-chain amino acid transport system permease protein